MRMTESWIVNDLNGSKPGTTYLRDPFQYEIYLRTTPLFKRLAKTQCDKVMNFISRLWIVLDYNSTIDHANRSKTDKQYNLKLDKVRLLNLVIEPIHHIDFEARVKLLICTEGKKFAVIYICFFMKLHLKVVQSLLWCDCCKKKKILWSSMRASALRQDALRPDVKPWEDKNEEQNVHIIYRAEDDRESSCWCRVRTW